MEEIEKLTIFDVSKNDFGGSLPELVGNMKSLEQLNVVGNKLSVQIPASICSLPHLL